MDVRLFWWLPRPIEVPRRANSVCLAVVRVSARDVLRERHENIGSAYRERDARSRMPIVDAHQTVALRPFLWCVQLTREQERNASWCADAQPTVCPLPVGIAADVDPARDPIPELKAGIAAVDPDVLDRSLHESVRVAALHACLGQQMAELQGAGDAELQLPKVAADNCLTHVLIVVARGADRHLWRERPAIVAQSIPGGHGQILKRGSPAAACVVRQARNGRPVTRVLPEHIGNAECRRHPIGNAVIHLDERARREALSLLEVDAVRKSVTGVLDELPGHGDRADSLRGRERLAGGGRWLE